MTARMAYYVLGQGSAIEGEGAPAAQPLLGSHTPWVDALMDAETREYLGSLQAAGGAGWRRS